MVPPSEAAKAVKRETAPLSVLFISSGLSGHYGGSAFSEAITTAALKELCDVRLACRIDRLDKTFASKMGCPPVQDYGVLDPLAAYFSKKSPFHRFFEDCQLVHINGHWSWQNYLISRLCRRKKIPYVMHPRGMMLVGHRRVWLKWLFNLFLGKRMAKQAATVIALSEFEKRHFKPYRLKENRVTVLPNGILPVNSGSTANYQDPYFLYLGRLEARKNLVFLVEVFAKYRKAGGKARLRLMGPIERGYDDVLKSAVERCGVTGLVQMVPPDYANAKASAVAGSLAVIYPSVEEAFGRVPFEAVSAGTLTIVPKQSGSAEYLQAFLKDCIYEDGNAESLQRVLMTVGGPGRETLESGRKLAQRWVHEELVPSKVAGRLMAVYTGILENNGR